LPYRKSRHRDRVPISVNIGGGCGLTTSTGCYCRAVRRLHLVAGRRPTEVYSSFNVKIRLRYAGPEADKTAYEAALPTAKLRVFVGSNTPPDFSISNQGEVVVWDIPGRLRDGEFGAELVSDRIALSDAPQAQHLHFPASDQVVELRAALMELHASQHEPDPAPNAARYSGPSTREVVGKAVIRVAAKGQAPDRKDECLKPTDDQWELVEGSGYVSDVRTNAGSLHNGKHNAGTAIEKDPVPTNNGGWWITVDSSQSTCFQFFARTTPANAIYI